MGASPSPAARPARPAGIRRRRGAGAGAPAGSPDRTAPTWPRDGCRSMSPRRSRLAAAGGRGATAASSPWPALRPARRRHEPRRPVPGEAVEERNGVDEHQPARASSGRRRVRSRASAPPQPWPDEVGLRDPLLVHEALKEIRQPLRRVIEVPALCPSGRSRSGPAPCRRSRSRKGRKSSELKSASWR